MKNDLLQQLKNESEKQVTDKVEDKKKYQLQTRKKALGLLSPKHDSETKSAWDASDVNRQTKASSLSNAKTSIKSVSRTSKRFDFRRQNHNSTPLGQTLNGNNKLSMFDK